MNEAFSNYKNLQEIHEDGEFLGNLEEYEISESGFCVENLEERKRSGK